MGVLEELIARCNRLHYGERWALKKMWVIGSLAAGKKTCRGVDVMIETGLFYGEKQSRLVRELRKGLEDKVLVYSRDFPPNWGVKHSEDPWGLIDKSPKHVVWSSRLG